MISSVELMFFDKNLGGIVWAIPFGILGRICWIPDPFFDFADRGTFSRVNGISSTGNPGCAVSHWPISSLGQMKSK